MLASLIAELIREKWDQWTLREIEQRLFERYGLSLEHCLFEFEKVDEVLRKFLGEGVEGLEQRFLRTWSRR